MSENILELIGITKAFPGVVANDDISLEVRFGEIHALLGENGAGKSTLMSILFGLYEADSGKIIYKGKQANIKSPREATELKIGMVHQHFKLVGNFTVLENIVLGLEDTRFGLLDMRKARQKVLSLSDSYGFAIDPDLAADSITVGMQQRVEILKMLYRDCELLIFDEPTAVLIPQEITQLMSIMKSLARSGKSIIFITHKLNEIQQVADRCTVLRKGKAVATVNVGDVSQEYLSELMVGRKVSLHTEKPPLKTGEAVLEVQGLSVPSMENAKRPKVKNISFSVNRGEIVCIAGVDGNGQEELVRAIAGLMKPTSGRIWLCGKEVTHARVRERSVSGMSHIPEDRQRDGLVLDYTLEENLILQTYFSDAFERGGFFRFPAIRGFAERLIEAYDIRAGSGASSRMGSMSGGNQQKAIVAREIDKEPELLIAVQPTRGLDIGAIEYIRRKIVEERSDGKAILLVSLELEEVMELSDRILVIFEGEITGQFAQGEIDFGEIGMYMNGSKRQLKEAAIHESQP